jgi:nucleoside-diphosphate-sugar epimerase
LEYLAAEGDLEVHHISSFARVALQCEDIHVIHAASPASFTSHQKNMKDVIESNVFVTKEICDVLKQTKGHLTYLSSGEVYGHNPKIPTREDEYSAFDHLSIRGSYPESKRIGELIAKTWSEMDGFTANALRVYHTFGPGLKPKDDRIFATAIYSLFENRNLQLNSDGLTTRSFTYSYDLVTAIEMTRELPGFDVFNVSSDTETSILDFAHLVASMGDGLSVLSPKEPQNLFEKQINSPIQRGAADNSKLKMIGWDMKFDLKSAVQRTIQSIEWRNQRGIS